MRDNILSATFLVLAVGVCWLAIENRELKQALGEIDNGYIDFMGRDLNGKKISEYIKPGSLGIFRSGKKAVVCGVVSVKD